MAAKGYAKLDLKGLRDLESGLERVRRQSVDFGYPEATMHSYSGMTHGELATKLEFGSGNIPARPAFRQTLESLVASKGAFEKVVSVPVRKFLVSRNHISDSIFRSAGEYLSEAYANTMDNWPRDNAPATRANKGFNKPFEETGELIDSVDYRVNGS